MSERPPGLRARKKEQTRQLLADTARGLFHERGFDRVTIAEIADAADVSEGTVFNYFPTKEALFFSGMDVFEERLVDAVRDRPAGVSALGAFRTTVLDGTRRLADPGVADFIEQSTTLIEGSPSLQIREREIVARYTTLLAETLAQDVGARPHDPQPLVAAAALMGAQRAVVAFVHGRVRAGDRGPKLASATRAYVRKAFALLDAGLAEFGVKREKTTSS